MAIIGLATPMPREMRILLDEAEVEVIIGVIARVLTGEEVLDVGDAHAFVIRHDGVSDDVAGFETFNRSGGR